VIRLIEPPGLVWPTREVRASYLVGEQADCLLRGTPTQWLEAAGEDFGGFVAVRRGVQVRWDVPSTVFWYVSGEYYLGTLVIRHQLTPALTEVGGHIGYHVVAPWRRQGHATRMLAAGLAQCRDLGLDRVLLTCAADNEPSRRVILANGGIYDGQAAGNVRAWPVAEADAIIAAARGEANASVNCAPYGKGSELAAGGACASKRPVQAGDIGGPWRADLVAQDFDLYGWRCACCGGDVAAAQRTAKLFGRDAGRVACTAGFGTSLPEDSRSYACPATSQGTGERCTLAYRQQALLCP
jgi:GNAT superfamily N-acetyltransferase